jgi:hypothetical protein
MEKLSITLTVNEWNVIMASLGKMPFEQVVNVVNEIKKQAEAQMISARNDEPLREAAE